MVFVPVPDNENLRIEALREYRLLDSPCEEIFDNIVRATALFCRVPVSLINLIDADRQFTKSGYGLSVKELPREHSFCSYTILGSDILEVQDTHHDERFKNNPLVTDEPKIRFYAGIPLTTPEGFRIGSLCVVDHKVKKLTNSQKDLLSCMSQVIMKLFELRKTVAMDMAERDRMSEKLQHSNCQLKKRIKEKNENDAVLSHFSKMNSMLQSCQTNDEAYQVIRSFCLKIFSGASGMLYLTKNEGEFSLVLSWNHSASPREYLSFNDCWALRRGQYHAVQSRQVDVICPHFTGDSETGSGQVCLPLVSQGETLGLFVLENFRAESDSKLCLLYALRMAEQISLSLANIKLKNLLIQQSTCDPLTGLYNRRYLSDVFKREKIQADRLGIQLGFILIDIDFFKKINDHYGHDAGDGVLGAVAQVLKNETREYDIVCRIGGEEFLLILHDISVEDLILRAETLRRKVSELHLRYHGKDLGKVTISLGLSIYPLHGKTLDEIVIASDKALYQAKESGRNQAILFKNATERSAAGLIQETLPGGKDPDEAPGS